MNPINGIIGNVEPGIIAELIIRFVDDIFSLSIISDSTLEYARL